VYLYVVCLSVHVFVCVCVRARRCVALWHFFNGSPQEHLRHTLVVGGAIPALVRLWSESVDEAEKLRCAVALCALSGSAGHGALIADGALPAVVALCTLNDDDDDLVENLETLRLAVTTLRSLAQHEENKSQIAMSGAVAPLAAIAPQVEEPLQGICVDLMCALAGFKPNLQTMIKDEALSSFLAVARASTVLPTLRCVCECASHRRRRGRVCRVG
jgi:hypothetical protein